MFGVDGIKSWNPFEFDFSNHLGASEFTAQKALA
jgi:hypothetical protein